MQIDFTGKTVFITGGSRGIGKRIKVDLVDCGAKVISPSREELDLSDKESVNRYKKKINDTEIDVFIHCAGVNKLASIEEIDDVILQDVFQVNCFSPISLLNGFVEKMKLHKYGKVVFVSSLYAMVSRERRLAYSASKNACIGVVKTTALELAPYNIMVNAVAPGYVMTDMTKRNLSDKEIKEIECLIPTRRFQSEEDIASAVLFLCSDMNNSITGQVLAVDGGFLCR